MSKTRVKENWFNDFYRGNNDNNCGCNGANPINDFDSTSPFDDCGCGCNCGGNCGGGYDFDSDFASNFGSDCGCSGEQRNSCPCSKYIQPERILDDLEKELSCADQSVDSALANLECLVKCLVKCGNLTRQERQLVCSIEQDLFEVKSSLQSAEEITECLENILC